MLHEDVLNFMLANTCHNTDDGEYTFDLHCMEVKVKAAAFDHGAVVQVQDSFYFVQGDLMDSIKCAECGEDTGAYLAGGDPYLPLILCAWCVPEDEDAINAQNI